MEIQRSDIQNAPKSGFWQDLKSAPIARVFVIAIITAALMFLPFVIYNRGMFTFYGDFNVQQIPFYMHAQDYIKSGYSGWDWFTDLGSNFLGSYSFYLLGSPFFWITLLFPNAAVPYLIAPLLILKFSFIAVTGFAFINRFTKTSEMAIIGALLYAFSGFNVYNIFFNHFHEAVLVFPLLLIAMEEELTSKRRGVFALAVALCAVTNYYFFFGQCVFAILYFIIRSFAPDVKMTFGKFMKMFVEALIGVALSAVLLYPSVLAILGNDRITDRLYGYDILIYNRVQRYALILESMFLPPDMPARPNFFTDSNSKWSSVSAYLPLFGMVGVITFLRTHNKHWIKRLLAACFVIAMVPILNSLFSALNWSYYARWFYMPLLLMSLATVMTFEEYKEDGDKSRFTAGFVWCGAVTLVCAIIGILPKKEDGEVVWFNLGGYPLVLWLYVAIAVIFLVVSMILIYKFMRKDSFYRLGVIVLCVCIVSYSWLMLGWGSSNGDTYLTIHDQLIKGSQTMELDEVGYDSGAFYRINSKSLTDNAAMYMGLPSVQAFQSVVPGSIMEFYHEIDYDRNVASRPEPTYAGLNGLTAVKYFFTNDTKDIDEDVPVGFTYWMDQNGFHIYTNDYYIPMGFTYEGYVDRYVMDGTAKKYRDRLMLHAIFLSDEDIAKYGNLLTGYTREDIPNLTNEVYTTDCGLRQQSTCDSFKIASDSFTATINLEKDNLVFFSVPYEAGWTAEVNGESREVIKANVGFMAVKADAGDNTITFHYETPGLKTGAMVTCGAILVWLIWCIPSLVQKIKRNKRSKVK